MKSFENQVMVQPEYISPESETFLISQIRIALNSMPKISGSGRTRIRRYGHDYTTDKEFETAPEWIPPIYGADSWTLNEYPIGHCITPHIDSAKFADEIHVLSLGVHTAMVFTPKIGAEHIVELLPRSLMSMRGEVRSTWKHSTLPTAEGIRYSIVYRRKA